MAARCEVARLRRNFVFNTKSKFKFNILLGPRTGGFSHNEFSLILSANRGTKTLHRLFLQRQNQICMASAGKIRLVGIAREWLAQNVIATLTGPPMVSNTNRSFPESHKYHNREITWSPPLLLKPM